MSITRRDFLRYSSIGFFTPYFITSRGPHASRGDEPLDPFVVHPESLPEDVFGLSIASGDPTPSGVILWTRLNPESVQANVDLAFEIALDDQFQQVVLAGVVAAAEINAAADFTVRVDVDGELVANRRFFYRFLYGGTASRTGRCRTLPHPGTPLEKVRFGVITCQDYTNGYYGALAQLAVADIDFVIHLGDFIYETPADPRFQRLPFPDRELVLPSEQPAAVDLNDYRFIYRAYRSDPALQRLMEQQTCLMIWDDHETANDCYWDYPRDTLGAPDHPFTKNPQYGNDPGLLRQLKFDAQRAWAEYVPARVMLNEEATHPFDFLQIYRSFVFGDLVELFMTDERTYRVAPPCGRKIASPGCPQQTAPTQLMLGETQRDWLIAGMTSSTRRWKVWGNEVFQGALTIGRTADTDLYATLDAWDGYEFERTLIMRTLKEAGVRNLVVLTGDLHTYMASLLKIDYRVRSNSRYSNLVGVEFMTPAVTSANLVDLIRLKGPKEVAAGIEGNLGEKIIRQTNPHIHFFNSQDWGYSIVEFRRTYCEYTAYSVDKSVNSPLAPSKIIRRIRVPSNQIRFVDVI